MYGGVEIEPLKDVEVTISYDDPIVLDEGSEILAVHFTDASTDIHTDVSTEENGNGVNEVNFTQDGFSVTGTLVTSPNNLENGASYIIVVQNNNRYYAMTNTGNNGCTATELTGSVNGTTVTIDNINAPSTTYLWTYNNRTLQNVSSSRYIYMSSSNFTNTSSRQLTFAQGNNGAITVRYGSYYIRYNNNAFSRNSSGSQLYFIKYEVHE